jgi:hypothetical protein
LVDVHSVKCEKLNKSKQKEKNKNKKWTVRFKDNSQNPSKIHRKTLHLLVWSAYSPHLDRSILVHAGNESDGSPIYVGRAHHFGDLIPGKLLTGQGFAHRCHVSYNGEEVSKDSSEVLINNGYSWASGSNGNVPANAVIGGRTSTGETLFIGRSSHCGILTPGKVHPSHMCLYLPFGWKEHRYPHYEVLVRNNSGGCQPPIHPPVCPPIHPPHRPPIMQPIHPTPPIIGPPHHRPQPPCGPGRGRGHGHHHHHPHGQPDHKRF